MTKQPLHNIDTLFQQKLEELPVDLAQQQAQWQSLSKTMKAQPGQVQTPLHQLGIKWLLITIIVSVPAAFYYFKQPPGFHTAQSATSTNVTQSLFLLRNAARTIPSAKEKVQPQARVELADKAAIPRTPVTILPVDNKIPETNRLPEKIQDSAQATPVKKEKPVTKKIDSTYIYWQ